MRPAPHYMKKILFVDDSMFIRKFFGPKLQAAGYQVTMASDGREAQIKASAMAPDLIIMDIDMPQYSGKDAALALRQSDQFKKTPIIIASAHVTPDIVSTLSQVNIKHFMAKPYSIDKLLEKIKTLID